MVSRQWIGGRASVALTFAVAIASVVTGIANIGAPPRPIGPIAALVPEFVPIIAGFTGALTGFLLLASAFGLRRGLRAAWYATMVLFPVTAAQGALQSNERAVPLVALSVVAFLVLGFNRKRFHRDLDLSATELAALAAIIGAQTYGTVGAYALREQFNGLDNLVDAFYFALVTGSTVGYGDITPSTPIARLFGMSVLLVTVSSFAVALGVLLTPAIEARLSKALGRMTETQLDLLENHVLVLGYGDLTEPILEELASKAPYVVITRDTERARILSDRDVDVFTADPSDAESLQRARVDTARAVVVATNNDAEDALAILTARQLNPEVRIVAAASNRENVDKLKRAGADTVISPTTLGGHLMAESALGGDSERVEQKVMEEKPSKEHPVDEEGDGAEASGGADPDGGSEPGDR
ncbi:potassium channel protein [Salinigranum rubrum]|uniref:Potassium channel protein n=1 Tax=Salinigranum rubrum TaxID=755307 RepID=A0A2I8VPD5_9EURY|nr:NAD-binding protein [Salinigranum rubrum]AUV82979.1 potassium channel protein [Salinigranum rubrum]